MRKESGFSLIELLIVILIIGILAAVLLPRLGESQKAANEAAAIQQIKNYIQGQLTFYLSHRGYGTAADLAEAGVISRGLAEQLGAAGTAISTNGYEGSATVSGDVAGGLGSRYAVELHPTSPGSSGDRSFGADESGTIWESSAPFTHTSGGLSLPGDAKSIQ
jgi:prepilin-type N-terminal cleavage/methylation domain-containing protein